MTDDNGWESVDITDQPHDHVVVGFKVQVTALATQSEEDVIKEAISNMLGAFTDESCPEEVKDSISFGIIEREYCRGHKQENNLNNIIDINKLLDGLISKKRKEENT